MRRTPRELARLLDANGSTERDSAWSAFVARYSSLILKTARQLSRDYDGAMDRYRFVLEQIRTDDFRRLRRYVEDPRAEFTSWLIVVVNRLCLDYHRRRYGRVKGGGGGLAARHRRAVRRRLADLEAEELDGHLVVAAQEPDPESLLRQRELSRALQFALGTADARDRLLLRLRFEDGLSVRQITRIMGFDSVFQVYRRLRTLTGRLRRQLAEQGIVDPLP